MCTDRDVFGVQIRKRKIPVEFKVLASLKILGRDLCCDEIDESLNISQSHTLYFFKQFINNFAAIFFDQYVHVPKGDELRSILKVYRRMGFPCCVGSMDVTHIYWDKCPNNLRFHCKGKEGKPTIAFQTICDHTRRINIAFFATRSLLEIILSFTMLCA